jgi:hypothetical protein
MIEVIARRVFLAILCIWTLVLVLNTPRLLFIGLVGGTDTGRIFHGFMDMVGGKWLTLLGFWFCYYYAFFVFHRNSGKEDRK